MNKEIIQGKWHELKGKVKSYWAKFSDDDLAFISGKREELFGLLQKKYGYERDKAEKELQAFIDKYCG